MAFKTSRKENAAAATWPIFQVDPCPFVEFPARLFWGTLKA
jgi:hypothetical protein